MSYSQLIQFKRLEERAFIFLNGRQLMFGVFGGFAGMSLANTLQLSGWGVWLVIGGVILLGIVAGARFRGLYGYQYLLLLGRALPQLNQVVRPEELYDRSFEADLSYVLGGPDGGALVLRQAPPFGSRPVTPSGEGAVYRLRPVDLAQHHPEAVAVLMHRWRGFWAGVRPPLRLVVHSTPFQAAGVVEAARSASLIAVEDWRARALAAYSRFLETLTREAAMYQAELLGVLTDYLGTGASFGLSRLVDTFVTPGPLPRKTHILIVSDSDLFGEIGGTEGGWETLAKAVRNAGGGATAALNLSRNVASYAGPLQQLRDAGVDPHLVSNEAELVDFARAFARRTYASERDTGTAKATAETGDGA